MYSYFVKLSTWIKYLVKDSSSGIQPSQLAHSQRSAPPRLMEWLLIRRPGWIHWLRLAPCTIGDYECWEMHSNFLFVSILCFNDKNLLLIMCDDRKSFCMIIISYTNITHELERLSVRTSQRKNFSAMSMRGFTVHARKFICLITTGYEPNNYKDTKP